MKQKMIKLAAFALLLAGIMLACGEKENADTYEKTGIVKYFPPPDHCNDYVIIVEDNMYKPVELPEEYKIDNCKIKLTYRITEEKHNCGYGGYIPVINILKIKKS